MLSAADLLEPKGVLTPDMFVGDDPTASIDAYIDAGTARAAAKSVNAGVLEEYLRAYVYHRAFARVATALTINPSSSSISDQGSESFSSEQIRRAAALAEKYQEQFEEFEPAPSPGVARTSPTGSLFLPTSFSF